MRLPIMEVEFPKRECIVGQYAFKCLQASNLPSGLAATTANTIFTSSGFIVFLSRVSMRYLEEIHNYTHGYTFSTLQFLPLQ